MIALVAVTGCGGAPDTTGPGGGGGTGAPTGSSTSTEPAGGPAFSKLPPLDVVGVEWVFEYSFFETGKVQQHACRIADAFTWPDGRPGSTVECTWDGKVDPLDDRLAFYPDRIELRDDGAHEYAAPAPVIYRVPVSAGDVWEEVWETQSFGWQTDHFTAVGEETVEVAAGTFDAVKLEHFGTNDGGTSEVVAVWWADGLGRVKIQGTDQEGQLVSFEVP